MMRPVESIPAALVRYYERLDAGDPHGAAANFTPDTVYAVPYGSPAETDAHLVVDGRAALVSWFADLPRRGVTHEVWAYTVDGGVALIEGAMRAHSGTVVASFLASASLSGEGLIDRYVAFACPPVADAMVAREASPSEESAELAAATDAAALVDRYFGLLEEGDFAGAVDCFSEDVVYSRPPYKHTGHSGSDRVTFRGHAELLAGFEKRGRQSFQHRITARAQSGGTCIFEGSMVDLPNDASGGFMSSLTIGPNGRIARYLSCYREPAIRL